MIQRLANLSIQTQIHLLFKTLKEIEALCSLHIPELPIITTSTITPGSIPSKFQHFNTVSKRDIPTQEVLSRYLEN